MNLWYEAHDKLEEAQKMLPSRPSADQLLQVAQVKALLSIGQELSLIQDQGINPEWSQRTFS